MRAAPAMPAIMAALLFAGAAHPPAQAQESGSVRPVELGRQTHDTPPARDGRNLFQAQCAACHDARGWGTRIIARRAPEGEAALEDRQALPASYVIAVVRRGMGAMPPIRKTIVSDADLAAIAWYLEHGE